MDKPKKLKMNAKTFRIITAPIMVLFLIFARALSIITNYFTPSLNAFLGKGARKATTPSGTSDWDTDYYDITSTSSEDALNNSLKTSENIADEGIVLLKNNGLLPLATEQTVTPFGYDYLNPMMSGSGSGSADTTADYVYTAEKGINEAFSNVNSASVDAMKNGTVHETTPAAASGEGGATAFLGSSTILNEYPAETYNGIEDSCKGTVGIVFLGRAGGEGGDLYAEAYDDGTPHQLALTDTERGVLDFAKKNCAGVVVVLNSCNTMQVGELEDDPDIDAVITMCTPGAVGFKSLGKILNGTVNPSGKTVDTFVADCTLTPTYVNFNKGDGATSYSNASYTRDIWLSKFKGGPDFDARFREYEEGVYMGYRWYETAADMDYFTSDNLPDGVTDPYYNRDNGVVYPFGYGLSYTTFTQKISSFSESGNTVTVSVDVTNTGKVAGKDVVQLYYTAPYTDFDVENMIEKSTVNLLDYGKTKLLEPGESDTVTITFNKEDMASYCFTHDNGNGTKGCYVLEGGDYVISARSDSHNVLDEKTVTVADTFWYDGSDEDHIRESDKSAQSARNDDGTPTGEPENTELGYFAVTNEFENANTYMTDPSVGNDVTILTRNDWANTQPSAPTDKTRTASDTVIGWLDYNFTTTDLGNGKTWDSVNDPVLGSNENSKVYAAEMPASNQKNGLTLSDMRGLSYYDEKWDTLLDQIDYSSSEMTQALFANAFASGELTSVGKPSTLDHDGPQGLALNDNDGNSWINCCSFPAATTLAQTWNKELAYEMGNAVGEENYWLGGSAWYAPAINLHWSPFSGRNYEYYSEDSIISGKTAAAVISGAGDKGTYCTLKHFAMVDQEADRWWIPAVWATEQTIREIYLKPFEIAVKEATKTIKYTADGNGTVATKTMRACDAMMTSGWSGIAGLYTAYDYNLLTNVLRNEWGFQGYVVTDYDQGNCANDDVAVNRMVRAGNDQHMLDMTLSPGAYTSLDTATGVAALRKAIKNTLFVIANSAQMDGAAPGATIYYAMAPWRVAVIAVDAIIALGILLGIVANVRRTKDNKNHPEKYKPAKKKNA